MSDRDPDPGADREWLVNQIAHALRNPIFAASVQSEALQLRIDDRAAVIKSLDALRGQLERLSETIDEMLLYGRPIRPALEDIDAGETLDAVASRFRAGDRQSPASIEVLGAGSGIVGHWDRGMVVAILERLLDNAIQHTEAPHEITVGVAAHGDDRVELTVEDAGSGMPPDILERAMLPFFPQHSGRAGLGLAVADKLAKALGGRIELESEEGEGTTARCVLPLRSGE
jgi:signal transduction histidine kinase